jgi:hypothetical protein
MEIKLLPLSQSTSDKQRASALKWKGMPPGMPPEMAIEFMARLQAGSTIRKLTSGIKKYGPAIVSYERFKKHGKMHPAWAADAWRISKVNGNAAKGHFRNRTHCLNGYLFAESARVADYNKGLTRQCRVCELMRNKRGGVIKPEVLEELTARLMNGSTISDLTKAGKKGYLVKFSTLARYRREHPDFNSILVDASRAHGRVVQARAQKLRWQRVRNATVRDDNNDYYKVRDMIPESNTHRDDIVARIFEDLLTGSLKREDVRARVKVYVAEFNELFPTKYAKFGNSPLVSLDEVMFEDGSTTRGDTVSRGLWGLDAPRRPGAVCPWVWKPGPK